MLQLGRRTALVISLAMVHYSQDVISTNMTLELGLRTPTLWRGTLILC